jgi:predicted small lipoprotein YifL
MRNEGSVQEPDRIKTKKETIPMKNMKKTFLLLAVACILSLLAACSSKPTPTEPAPTDAAPTEQAPTEQTPTEPAPTEPAPTEPTSSRDLQMLYQSGITAMGADAPVLFPVSDISELSPLFPGLEEISFRQVSGGLSPVTGAPDEVVLLEVENSADVQKVVDILQKAVDEGAAESVGTDAAIAAAWKDNASITTDGNYICLAVFMNGVSIPAEFMLP